jgi:hypothetical protein
MVQSAFRRLACGIGIIGRLAFGIRRLEDWPAALEDWKIGLRHWKIRRFELGFLQES